jgi:hypothetical protein
MSYIHRDTKTSTCLSSNTVLKLKRCKFHTRIWLLKYFWHCLTFKVPRFKQPVTLTVSELNARISTKSTCFYLKIGIFNNQWRKTVEHKAFSKEMFVLQFSLFPILLNHRLHCAQILNNIIHRWSSNSIASNLIWCLKCYFFIHQ